MLPTGVIKEDIVARDVTEVNSALREALKTALIQEGLACGISKAAKALARHRAHRRVLASTM